MTSFVLPLPSPARTPFKAWFWAIMVTVAALATSLDARADIYTIDRAFSDGVSDATLTGTVEVPEGSYVIMNRGSSPLIVVNLTLTVNGTPYNLDHVLTGLIYGTGEFLIDATPSTLTFGTAFADGGDPADLIFSDNSDPLSNNRYVIGHNGSPDFEAAYTGTAGFYVAATLPTVFGTPVPEPKYIGVAFVLSSFGLRGIRYIRGQK